MAGLPLQTTDKVSWGAPPQVRLANAVLSPGERAEVMDKGQ